MTLRPLSASRLSATLGSGPSTILAPIKLVSLGDFSVGKSSLVLRFCKDKFHERHRATPGAIFLTQTVCFEDTTVNFRIWDTAGQERFHSLTQMYYRGAQAAIVVYDITNASTFARAKMWVSELQSQALPDIVIALAGNKSDLADSRAVDYKEANGYAEENGLLFMETSAKNGNNVNEIFLAITRKLPQDSDEAGRNNSTDRQSLLTLGQNSNRNKRACCKR